MNIKQAIDILKNSIADYVIGEYCEKCADNKICNDRNEDCYYQQAIDIVVTAYEKEKEERERIGKLYYEANENCIKYEKMIKKEKEKNEYLPAWVGKKYVSKDKIKAKIEELKVYKTVLSEPERQVLRFNIEKFEYGIEVLCSLLEKE